MGAAKDIISILFNYTEQNKDQILIRCVLRADGRGGGEIVTLQSLLSNKKGTSPFVLQPNERFLKFIRKKMTVSNFLHMYYWKRAFFGGGYPPSDYSES